MKIDRENVEEFATDWFLNVWDEIGSETTKEQIVEEFSVVLGENAEVFVDKWFKDHVELLRAYMSSPVSLAIIAYEDAIRNWIRKQLDILGIV